MSPGSSTESYLAFARIGLRENPGKNLNQVTCPDRESNPGHLVSRPDALTVTPQFSRKMTERIEQRYCIKFCQKLGDFQSQTIRKIQQVFGEDAMGVTQIKEWFNRFKDGRTSVEHEQRCGRPQTARSAAVVERVRNLVMADRRLTVLEIAEEVGVSKDSAHAILREDLNMNRVAAKFVPKLLSPEQKDLRRDVAQDLLDTANTDPGFLEMSHGCTGTTQKQKDSRNGSILSLQGRRKRGRCEAKSR
ncbi:hypothetical protein ANN_12449 [Periplaneta americana]|uniref:Mos1 transposase HTH domain-containing protein n=1 Tax=Periplaneta americana TaxID=6978 RepID=A0ABQ8TGQ7_PERAM|nr:hypothetical protein ANN_12449 [Periplaneta americana]